MDLAVGTGNVVGIYRSRNPAPKSRDSGSGLQPQFLDTRISENRPLPADAELDDAAGIVESTYKFERGTTPEGGPGIVTVKACHKCTHSSCTYRLKG